jgi:hypothetical protein
VLRALDRAVGWPLSRGHSRRDSAGANHGEKRFLNGVIDPQAAKGNATRLAIVHPAAVAAVARDVVLRARVAKRQLAPAAAATKQARQQSVAVLGRTVMAAGGDVAAHQRCTKLGENLPLARMSP